ncbi:Heavy metal-associated isoprenylated plant protein 41 [Zea mays]|uniref:Heavy metal-associated isoprenylated plant protein 41 n=1 Tax=Zea mays TaxID=4577 RepID=A0A317Y804_MAIZE|nr:Heavy metal-associated isoprenylated plant protein 41 [Zea mays]
MGSGSSKTTTADGLDHPHALLRTDVEIGVTTSSHSVSPKLGGDDDDSKCVSLHKELVWGFFRNARHIVRQLGEVHVTHKSGEPYGSWDLEHLASESSFAMVDKVPFQREDYPGYNQKRGDGSEGSLGGVSMKELGLPVPGFYRTTDGKDTEEQSHCSPSWSSEGNLKYTLIFILELLPMAKLAKLWRELLTPTSKGGGGAGEGFDVTKSGDARVGLVGFPSIGKSTLLNKLTGTFSEDIESDDEDLDFEVDDGAEDEPKA